MLRSRAFTILELLACGAVVTTLIAIAAPSLSSAMASRTLRQCEWRIRNADLLLSTYAAEHGDALPFGPEARTRVSLSVEQFEWGGKVGLRHGTWSFLFRDEWAEGRWNASMRCPRQPTYSPTGGASRWDRWPTPAYCMTEAVWLAGSSMTADGPVDWRLKRNNAADVRFPSSKVYLTEWPGFCATEHNADGDIELGQTLTQRVAMSFFDGSVRRARVSDGRAGAGGSLPVLWTVDGLAGRDFP